MAKNRPDPQYTDQSTPGEYPRTRPMEYLPATDNLFVAHHIGKLTETVERLTGDVKAQGGKIATLAGQAPFVKGALYVGGVAFTAILAFVYFLLNAKWEKLIEAVQPLLGK